MPSANLLPDRLLVAAAVVLTCVLFVPDASDPVNVVKLSALLVCALALAALALTRVVRDRVVQAPVGVAGGIGALLLAAFALAAVVAPHTPTAVWGTLGRNSGLLAYASAVLLFLLSLRLFDAPSTRVVAFGVLLSGFFTGAYGAFQLAGVDAVGWNNPFNPVIAALGNPDFASGYLGIAIPVAVWATVWTGWARVWRVASALVGVLMLVVTLKSSAIQGPLAAAAGLGVLLVAGALSLAPKQRRAALAAIAAVAVLAVALLVAGALGAGPVTAPFTGISYEARTWYWGGALTMFRHSPVWGVGLDSYGIRWPADRPIEVPQRLGGDHFSDAAHSVPLQMLAQGGLLLGLVYLAFVLLVAVCLVRGLLRLQGQERLLLAGLGGAWLAYQVQSLVSIDQVPLLVVHFVLSGAVVVASGSARLREVRLPGALPVAQPGRTGRRVAIPTQRQATSADTAVVAVVAVVALGLAWFAVRPVQASRDAFAGDAAAATGDGDTALADYESAIDLAPTVVSYQVKKASLYNSAGQAGPARTAFEQAAAENPFDLGSVRTSGRLAASAGDLDAARRYFERAVRLDPTNSSTVLDLADFDLQHGAAQQARDLLEPLVRQLPGDAGLWATLGDARAVLKDTAGAREAYQRALAITPPVPDAVAKANAGLAKLSPAAG